jgi:hypothetical protein
MPASLRRARTSCAAASLVLFLASKGDVNASEPSTSAVVCTVAVEHLPAASLVDGGYELLIADQAVIPLPSSGQVTVSIVEPVVVSLRGAAYRGSVNLDPDDCGTGVVHALQATPKPAKLLFQIGAVPLADLVVSCVSGCEHRLRPAERFPELPLPADDLELVVALEFKARGHHSQIAEYKLYPGDNAIRVSLQRLADR